MTKQKVGTITPAIPVAEQMPDREPMCPPHDFEAAWATPRIALGHDDTVPALFCRACGDVREFRIPDPLTGGEG